jgi:hypothetical protein
MPGRLAVFFQVWWRSLVVAIGGGVMIAVGFVIVVTLAGETFEGFEGEDGSDGLGVVMLLAAYFGAAFGLVLGVVAGLLLALLASLALVPYRGRRRTVTVMRIGAAVCVAAFFGLLSGGTDRLWYVLGAAGVLGAVLLAPWLVRWYVRRAEPSSS